MVVGGLIIFSSLLMIVKYPIVAIGGTIVGLFLFPQTWVFLSKKFHKTFARKEKIMLLLVVMFLTPFINGITESQNTSSTTPAPVVTQAQKDSAQKDLTDLMVLGKKSGLVQSYTFDVERIVYVGPIWYTQTVEFKKDFLAKISSLLVPIKGKTGGWEFLEVRDAYSNEKVAEVTAFTGSLEVYK